MVNHYISPTFTRDPKDEQKDDNEDDTTGESDSVEGEDDSGGSDSADSAAKETSTEKEDQEKVKVPRSEKRIKQLINLVKQKEEEKARALYEEQMKRYEIEQRLGEYEKALAETYSSSSEVKIKSAESKLRKAKENVDIDLELEATRELQEAILEKQQAAMYKNSVPNRTEQQKPASVNEFYAEQKTRAWIQANPDLVNSIEMKNLVSRVAKDVEKEGLLPHEDDYYTEINKRLNTRFAQYDIPVKAKSAYSMLDDIADSADDEEAPVKDKKTPPAPPAKKTATNPMSVGSPRAPAKKASTGGVQGRASAEDAAFARRLGVDPTNFLKNAMLEEKTNKFGYTPVYIPTKKK